MQKLRKKKIKAATALGVARLKYNSTTRKFTYVRFADDFIIFV